MCKIYTCRKSFSKTSFIFHQGNHIIDINEGQMSKGITKSISIWAKMINIFKIVAHLFETV